jgi:hypothetical protein
MRSGQSAGSIADVEILQPMEGEFLQEKPQDLVRHGLSLAADAVGCTELFGAFPNSPPARWRYLELGDTFENPINHDGQFCTPFWICSGGRRSYVGMPEPCYKKKGSNPPVCAVHNVPLIEIEVSIDSNVHGLGKVVCFRCPVSKLIVSDS